jgi:adenylyltransferase/sulfurtransferase
LRRGGFFVAATDAAELVVIDQFLDRRIVAADGASEMTVKQLAERLKKKDKFVLLDVREQNEFDIARIPGSKLIPLSELGTRVNELDTADDIVVHCKSGMRSQKAINQLKQLGFKKLTNVKGGILAWSDEIDPAVPKY